MKITIITAALNPGPEVRQTIESVLTQDVDALQYVFIDGGSRPECFAHVEPYAHRIHRLLREPDEGISDAWNKGIALAEGDVIGFLNADDYLLPGALRRVMKAFEAHPGQTIVHGNVIRLVEPGPMMERPLRPLPLMLRLAMPVNHPATFVARSVLAAVGGFDTRCRIAMDYDFILRSYLAGVRFVYVDEPFTVFRHGGLSDRHAIQGHSEVLRSQRENHFNRGFAGLIYRTKLCIRSVAKPILAKLMQRRYRGIAPE